MFVIVAKFQNGLDDGTHQSSTERNKQQQQQDPALFRSEVRHPTSVFFSEGLDWFVQDASTYLHVEPSGSRFLV